MTHSKQKDSFAKKYYLVVYYTVMISQVVNLHFSNEIVVQSNKNMCEGLKLSPISHESFAPICLSILNQKFQNSTNARLVIQNDIKISVQNHRNFEKDCISLSQAESFEKSFYRSQYELTVLLKNQIDGILLTKENWPIIFAFLCWPELLNSYGTCDRTGKDSIQNFGIEYKKAAECSLMDFFFASRHYHPYAGFSGWSNIKNVYPAYHSDLPRIFMRKEYLDASLSVNYHRRLGLIGVGIMLLVIAIAIFQIKIKHSTAALLDIFDIRQHWISLWKCPTKVEDDRFLFLESLRVISMLWVFLGHSALYWIAFLPFKNAVQEFAKGSQNFLNYPFFTAVFAVDNFLFISGVLTGYHFYYILLRNQQKTAREKHNFICRLLVQGRNFAFYVVHRYIRLMGAALTILFSYLALNCTKMALPTGSRYLQATNIACSDNIVSVMTLINNVAHGEFVNECFNWTWYLSVDFQFFVLNLVLTHFALFFSTTVFNVITSLLHIVCIVYSSYIAFIYHLTISVAALDTGWHLAGRYLEGRRYFPLHPLMDYFYVKPWVRIGPNLLGLSLGIALAQCKNCSVKWYKESKAAKIYAMRSMDEKKKVLQLFVTESSSSIVDRIIDDNYAFQHSTIDLHLSKIDLSTDIVRNAPEYFENKISASNCILGFYIKQSVHDKTWLVGAWNFHKLLNSAFSEYKKILPLTNVLWNRMNNVRFQLINTEDARKPNELQVYLNVLSAHLSVSSISISTLPSRTNPKRLHNTVRKLKKAYYIENDMKGPHISSTQEGPIFHPNFLTFPYRSLVQNHVFVLAFITLGMPLILIAYAHHMSRYPNIESRRVADAVYMAIQRPLYGASLCSWTLLMIFFPNPIAKDVNLPIVIATTVKCIKQLVLAPIWLPLAKLSYCIYLTHPMILFAYYGQGYGPLTFDKGKILFSCVCTSLITFIATSLLYLLVECPIKRILYYTSIPTSTKKKT